MEMGECDGKGENRRAQVPPFRANGLALAIGRMGPGCPGHRRTVTPSLGRNRLPLTRRSPCGTARAYTPSCRSRFGGCSTPRACQGLLALDSLYRRVAVAAMVLLLKPAFMRTTIGFLVRSMALDRTRSKVSSITSTLCCVPTTNLSVLFSCASSVEDRKGAGSGFCCQPR